MHIISKFSDYYDCGISYGVDKTVRYERKTEEYRADLRLPESVLKYRPIGEYSNDGPSERLTAEIVGFCGKLYVIAVVKIGEDVYYCSTYSQLQDALAETKFLKKLPDLNTCWYNNRYLVFLDRFKEGQGKYVENDELFKQIGVPIFSFSPLLVNKGFCQGFVTKNPNLKDRKFSSIVDPYTAFQELSMYLANQLANVEVPVVISDTDMRDSKGFDNKSFKKRK